MEIAQRMIDEVAEAAGYTADASDIRYQSRDEDFDLDFLFDDDDSIESTFAKEYATHHEDIGEVLRNIADIDIAPKKVAAAAGRTGCVFRGSYRQLRQLSFAA
ncbi:hypothetical protein [Ruminococcus sp.]|uniref:hypothetical protein n=1 Tax=Ruminococcus sp. TaxID=41978 RepID=UPI003890F704